MDEFDIEVTRLDPRIRDDAAQRGEPSSQADQIESGMVTSPPIPAPDDPSLGRPSASGRRTPRVIAIFALSLLIATLLLLIEGPAAQDALRTLRPTTTPSAALAGSGRIFFLHSVPWGALRVDHQPGPNLNAAPRALPDGRPVWPYSDLPPGRHLMQYDAEPFPHFECLLSIPGRRGDTCALTTIDVGRLLDLGATAARLIPQQQAALVGATQAALAAATAGGILTPGARYRGADGAIVVAQEQLYADLFATLNQDPARTVSPAIVSPQPCVTFCETSGIFIRPIQSWPLYAHVVVSWRYRRLTASGPGDVVLDPGPAAELPEDRHVLARLAVTWSGNWEVRVASALVCDVAAAIGDRLLEAHIGELKGYSWPDFPSQPATACLFIGGRELNAQGIPTGVTAYELYRFGVLIAANDEAHRLFPELPVATADEAALARQIATAAVGTG